MNPSTLLVQEKSSKRASWWWKSIPEESIQHSNDALRRGLFTTGPRVADLERVFAEAIGGSSCTLTNSGTSALIMALLDCGVGPGDEVIVPALSWIATAQAARILGASVKVIDVDYDSMGLDPESFAAAVSPATRAVIPVFFNGHSPRLTEIEEIAREFKISVIEDRCKALGTTIRSSLQGVKSNNLAAFSLGMISPVSIGYGGVLTSVTDAVASRHKQLRDHGIRRNPDHYDHLSINFKISDVLASLGVHQVNLLSKYVEISILQEQMYSVALSDSQFGTVVAHQGLDVGTYCMFLAYSSRDCDEVLRQAELANIPVARYHPTLDGASYLDSPYECRVAHDLSSRLLHLPCGPDMDSVQIARAIDLLS